MSVTKGSWKICRSWRGSSSSLGCTSISASKTRGFAVDAMNTLRYFTPHVLALSSSSPFWEGRNTGLHSYRSAIFKHFPRTGLPIEFNSRAEYDDFINVLVQTNCIPDGSKIYWDLRPHHQYSTLEFRICDLCTHVDDAICCAASFQALVLKHYKMRTDNITFRTYSLTPHRREQVAGGALRDSGQTGGFRQACRGPYQRFTPRTRRIRR